MQGFQGYTQNTQIPHLDREMPLMTNKNYTQERGKEYLQNIQNPEEMKKIRIQQAKKKYEQLLQKVEFFEHDQFERTYFYEKGLIPYIYFWKALARKPEGTEQQIKSTINRLKIWIPDTIVLGDEDLPPMWFYSSPEGFVYRTDTFTKKHISAKLSNYSSPDELVAVFKKPGLYDDGELNGNEVKLASARECQSMTNNAFQEQVGIQVIQKYVKSNGPKAFVCRTVWRKGQNPYSWIITNKADYFPNENIPNYNTQNKGIVSDVQKYIVQPRNMGSCTIVNTCRGKYVDETVPYIENILRYLDIQLGLKFKEFVADFIKDESGIWWMVNVKAFKLLDSIEFVNLKPITNFGEIDYNNLGEVEEKKSKYAHTKMKVCKYCEINMPETDLAYKMTLKMIIQTDRHLMHRSKNYSWLKRSDFNGLDPSTLYQEHKVCVLCYKIYQETEKLLMIEHDFAKKLGIPCGQESRYEILNLKIDGDPQEYEQVGQKDMYGGNLNTPDVPPSWQMDIRNNGRLIVTQHQPKVQYQVEKKLYSYRLTIMFDSLMKIPAYLDFNDTQYYIQYEIFGQTVKYKLDFTDREQNKTDNSKINIHLDKIRCFYFFSKGQKITNQDDDFFRKEKKKQQKQQTKSSSTEEDDQGRKAIQKYLNYKQFLTIKLMSDYQEIGKINLDLIDLVTGTANKHEFQKFFSGKDENIIPTLTWGLNLIVGLSNNGAQNVTKLHLDEHDGIYLPKKNYYTCEPLPQEWIQMFKDRHENLNSSRRRKMNESQSRNQKSMYSSPQRRFQQSHQKNYSSTNNLYYPTSSIKGIRKDSQGNSQTQFPQINSMDQHSNLQSYDNLSQQKSPQKSPIRSPNQNQESFFESKKGVKFAKGESSQIDEEYLYSLNKIQSNKDQQHDTTNINQNTTLPRSDLDTEDELSTLKFSLLKDLKNYDKEAPKKLKKKIHY